VISNCRDRIMTRSFDIEPIAVVAEHLPGGLVIWWGEMVTQGEGERCRPVGAQGADSLLRLVCARQVSFGNPPTSEVSLGHSVKELPAAPEDGTVEIAQDEGGEVLDVGPHREVDDHAGALASVPGKGLNRGRVALIGLKPPHETRSLISGGVHRIESLYERRQLRVIQGCPEAPDVDLRKAPTAHGGSLSPAATGGQGWVAPAGGAGPEPLVPAGRQSRTLGLTAAHGTSVAGRRRKCRRVMVLRMTPESTIVVESRKELTYLLCQGAELEHALMCQYLYAAFSLKTTPGPGVRDDQLEAIQRWRSVILSISHEEMLHWAMVQNLLTAVGSAPYVSRPHMPHQANGYPPGLQLRLLPFGEAALQHFVYLERPEGLDVSDAAGFEHEGPAPAPMSADEIVPRGQNFTTQGHLYRAVEAGLVELAHKLGEDQLFIGPAFHQADENTFRWPDLSPIVDLEGASRALQRIVEQGEGAQGEWTTAHFGRFLEVLREYEAMRDDDPEFEPAHPVVAAGMRAVEGVDPDFYITDRATGMVSDLFNAIYELLLQLIARYFAFGHETSEQRAALAHVAVHLMFGAIDPLGLALAQLKIGPEHPGLTAGANFQLPYRANFLLPHRRSAWIRFVERLNELAIFARGIGPFEGDEVVNSVAETLGRMAGDLAAHIEPVSTSG
jgi:hypothetical protein